MSGAPSSTWTSSFSFGAAGDLGDVLAQAAVEEERLGVGVVEEVDELLLEVPVVDVDGHRAQLERAEQAFDVLVGVVEVRRDLRVGSETGGAGRGREAGRAVVELAPGARSPWMSAVWSGSASATDSKIDAKFQFMGAQYRGPLDSPRCRHRGRRRPSERAAAARNGSRGPPTGSPATRPRGCARRDRRASCRSPRSGGGSSASPARLVPELPVDFPIERRASAVLVPLFEEDGEARLILTKRPETMPSHQGEIAFPGGKLEPTVDADLRATALREAHEEIGLEPAAVEIVAELDGIGTVASRFVIAPFVGILDGAPGAATRYARGGAGLRRRAVGAAGARGPSRRALADAERDPPRSRCTSSSSPTRRSGAQPPGFSTVFCITSSPMAECAARER